MAQIIAPDGTDFAMVSQPFNHVTILGSPVVLACTGRRARERGKAQDERMLGLGWGFGGGWGGGWG